MPTACLCLLCLEETGLKCIPWEKPSLKDDCYQCGRIHNLKVVEYKDLQTRLEEIEQEKKEKAEGIKTYRVIYDITGAFGWQQYLVKAKSEEEALQRCREGEAEFDCEEIEMQGLGDPYIGGIDES